MVPGQLAAVRRGHFRALLSKPSAGQLGMTHAGPVSTLDWRTLNPRGQGQQRAGQCDGLARAANRELAGQLVLPSRTKNYCFGSYWMEVWNRVRDPIVFVGVMHRIRENLRVQRMARPRVVKDV
jgi:hypothetical protein